MHHGVVEVFAFQEALLIEAAFGLALLTMIWVGFRRWLQHKEKMGRLAAEHAAKHGAEMERVEARLDAIEQLVAGSGTTEQIEMGRANPHPDPISKADEIPPES